MLSDVTISFGGQSISFPGLYLLIGVLIVLGLIGFAVAITSSRRIDRKGSEVSDILVVQLERIGDALDRIVSQNAARVASKPVRPRNRALPEWATPVGNASVSRVAEGLERLVQKPVQEPVQAPSAQAVAVSQEKPEEEEPVESKLSEPARSILFSMLGR